MPLILGTKLGPYEIQSPLGAGGMGEVYRARDTRLGRDVAIKLLPESFARDEERLRRFQQEARTVAALNHPNILAVFDVGQHEACPYLVCELLEGQTMRERLRSSPLPPRKAVELLAQIAEGLAAAHEKGVIHRDLKPENIFITRDNRVKILDFGLAKLHPAKTALGAAANGGDGLTAAGTTQTTPGVVLGTVGYMSPEQVRGRELDGRSDIFSFGAIAYEMLSGKRAFGGDSSVETMNAILKEEPPELDTEKLHVSPGLERIVRHCLEKDSAHRFQSARDLAFDISALSQLSGSSAAQAIRGGVGRPSRHWLITAALGIVIAVAAVAITMALGREPRLDFQQLTFRRGDVFAARFAPDRKTILYSAQWGGDPDEIFSTVADSRESRSLGLGNSELMAVSSKGELAVLLKPQLAMSGFLRIGTLAEVSMVAGTVPREIAENVVWADWSPDGNKLAIVRKTDEGAVLEYPIGTTVYKTGLRGWISHMRVSPKGDAIAFLDHPEDGDDRGRVLVIGTDGKPRITGGEFNGIQGLAWAPNGDLWFTAVPNQGVAARQLIALSPSGKRRVLLIVPGEMTVHDISPDGLGLITVTNRTRSITAVVNGKERNLEWLDRSVFVALTGDGSTIVFHEGGKAGGPLGTIYLRNVDGSPALRLADGYALVISPDKKWVISRLSTSPPLMRLIPTGAGEPKTISAPPDWNRVMFAADRKHLLWNVLNGEHKFQTFQTELDGSNLRPYTPSGTIVEGIADGGCCEVRRSDDRISVLRLASGTSEPLHPARTPVIGASADLQTYYLADRSGSTVKLWASDVRSNSQRQIGELTPHDATGVVGIDDVGVSNDGKTIAYGYTREVSELYLAKPAK